MGIGGFFMYVCAVVLRKQREVRMAGFSSKEVS